jgi:hypothetical protein
MLSLKGSYNMDDVRYRRGRALSCLEHKNNKLRSRQPNFNHPIVSPTGSATEDRTPLKEGE